MFVFLSLILFATFLANVLMGAFGASQFMGDVGEMLVLLAATACFVVMILQREAAEKNKTKSDE